MRRLAAAVGTFVLATVPLAAVDPRPAGQLAGFIGIGTTPEFLTEWFRTPPEHTPTIPLVTRFAVGETNPALDLVFDPGDPLGKWSVVAIFHDLVANKGSILEVHIELVAK